MLVNNYSLKYFNIKIIRWDSLILDSLISNLLGTICGISSYFKLNSIKKTKGVLVVKYLFKAKEDDYLGKEGKISIFNWEIINK
jgi:hypothetical protein